MEDQSVQSGHYAQTPHAVAQDSTLSGFAKSVYMVIHSFDWQGSGCRKDQRELALLAGWGVTTTKEAIEELEAHGLLRVERRRGASSVYFIQAPPSRHTANHLAATRLTTDGGSRQTANFKAPPSRHTANHLAATRLHKKKTKEEDIETTNVVSSAAQAPMNDQAAALCETLRVPPSPANHKAMANVVRDLAPPCQRDLEDLALEAAGWLDSHKGRARTVAFFRNWVKREIEGPPQQARAAEGRRPDGEHRGRARADETAHVAAAERRDRLEDERLAKHIARGGTRESFYGL